MSQVFRVATGVPGEIVVGAADRQAGEMHSAGAERDPGVVELNTGRPVTAVTVVNQGDRPIQVGSHYHFAEANRALSFDRDAAWGRRLDIPAGTSSRFEAGIERSVNLVPLTGRRVVPGLRGLAAGPLERREVTGR